MFTLIYLSRLLCSAVINVVVPTAKLQHFAMSGHYY